VSATVLVADDDAAIRTVVRQALLRAGHDVRTTDTAAGLWRMVEEGLGDVIVTDVVLPDADGLDAVPRILARRPNLPVIVMSAQNTLSTAVRATQNGAFEYLPKPFDINELTRVVASALEQVSASRGPVETGSGVDERLPLLGRSAAMQEVYRIIARVVPTDLSVLIFGESGTGKELVARALHDLGPRRTAPFVAVNMAAIPRELIESELFGHERGAFTGAQARTAGRFEQAQGGTLFLDEIGDMPTEAQTRLLRVLQSGEFTTVGGSRTLRADVRIIAATNKDLRRLIEAGQFREDLFYRLNVVPLRLPPLRARAEDIFELAVHFLARAQAEGLPAKQLDPAAVERMRGHNWPGNVRELENLMRRLAVLVREDTITAAAVDEALGEGGRLPAPASGGDGQGLSAAVENHLARYFMMFGDELPPEGVYDRVLAEVERPLLTLSLLATNGNQIRAAKMLGINRNTLRKKLNELRIDAAQLRAMR
jgi:two-component system, NtrC family, nitrogen regulation response regulator GlnG